MAERLGRTRLLVLKGGGGEAERVPAKPGLAYLWDRAAGRSDVALPAEPMPAAAEAPDLALFRAVWRGEAKGTRAEATVLATIALGLIALGRTDTAAEVWGR